MILMIAIVSILVGIGIAIVVWSFIEDAKADIEIMDLIVKLDIQKEEKEATNGEIKKSICCG